MTTNQEVLRSKLRIGFAQLPYLLRALGLVWVAARRWMVVWFLLLVFQGLLPVATVYLTRALVNSLVAALQADTSWNVFLTVLPLVILMAALLLLAQLLNYASDFVGTVQAELVKDHISGLIHKQAVAADLAFYDNPDYYDRLYRAQSHAMDRPLTLLENTGSVWPSPAPTGARRPSSSLMNRPVPWIPGPNTTGCSVFANWPLARRLSSSRTVLPLPCMPISFMSWKRDRSLSPAAMWSC